jgi:hypothetical protein
MKTVRHLAFALLCTVGSLPSMAQPDSRKELPAMSSFYQLPRNCMTAIHVKADGSGDFTEIQEAINSIKDASPENPYVVYVHDDILITDLTKLWHVNSRERVSDPAAIRGQVAAIIPDHWIQIVGVGSPRTIEIVSPKDLPVQAYQFIQVAYPMGNCVLDNFRFIITGGRYAIHQEAGGSKTHRDYWATTVYRNIYAEHKGNVGYPEGVWRSVHAQANGTTSGSTMIHINCEWRANNYTPYYTHTNKAFDGGNTLVFDHCKMHLNNLSGVRWSDIGSGYRSTVVIRNSDFGYFHVDNHIRGSERALTNADEWRDGGADVIGGGNTIMTAIEESPATLYFEATAAGQGVKVVGGDAAELIVGGEPKTLAPAVDKPGAFWANKRIQQVHPGLGNTRVFTLQHRLGNCVANPKTLVLEVGGETITVTFAKNYVTADGSAYSWDTEPAVPTKQVIDDINQAANGRFTCRLANLMRIYSFRDCMVSVQNKTATTFDLGQALVRDYAAGWACYRLAMAGEKPDAIAAGRIPIHDPTKPSDFDAIGFGKAIFRGSYLGLSGLTPGALIKAADNGAFQTTTDPAEAAMVALDGQYVQALP